jgi:cysteinyl-tRNA synthetase
VATPFRLYNTRTRDVEPFEPLVPGCVGLYVCGMTVYDECHIGHARAMVTFDTFVRYLRYRGWQVKFVRNFTDVDDKIIRRAQERGTDAAALAQHYIDRFHDDMRELGLAQPDAEPRVTTTIPKITEIIARLVELGHAYPEGGSVWFSVPTFSAYGALSGQQPDQLRSEDAGTGKRHPADFALWKAAKPGEPAWDSPWGPGRPGWHVECSAMAWDTLGETIDIHGGGLDLVFPHHENEVAQSECAHKATYARYWMHNGLLTLMGDRVTGDGQRTIGELVGQLNEEREQSGRWRIKLDARADRQLECAGYTQQSVLPAGESVVLGAGRKMGKSEGNVVEIREALRELPAEALRLYYLQNHYRSPLPYDQTALTDALGMLGRLYEAREVGERMGGEEEADQAARALGADAMSVLELGRRFPELLHKTLDEDFNTGAVLGHAFELARAVNRLSNHKQAQRRGGPVVKPALRAFGLLGEALGLLQLSTAEFQAEIKRKRLPLIGTTAEQIDALVNERAEVRAQKDWARADAIRAELESKGIAVMDRPDGSEWRVRLALSADR